ncbi:MAG: DNA cytosine methyltransferase [Thermoplasmatota archaeon]
MADVFAGSGGFSFGFSEEGCEIVAAVENHRIACETYARNVPCGFVLEADVRNVEKADIPPFDVLIGGPPCEGFTVANADRRANPLDRLYKDPRGSLTIQFVKLLKLFQPRAFVMENVAQILDGPLEGELRMLFSRAGYAVRFHILEASELGTPSRRRRVFASNLDLTIPLGKAAAPSVREVIGDIEEIDGDLPNHIPAPLKGKRLRETQTLEAGQSLYQYRAADGRVHGHYTRIRADEVAPTIKGLSRFIHYERDRLLTPREHARLMGYPDDYVFQGSRTEEYNQVGESVPPPVSRAIAAAVKRAMQASDPEAVRGA